MIKKEASEKTQRKEKQIPPFFNFRAKNFSKLARDYHNELHHLTIDLVDINRRLQESIVLCYQQVNFIEKPKKYFIPHSNPVCFKDAQYHIENFNFRITSYRDKLVQFINQALKIGIDEKTRGMFSIVINHQIVKTTHLDTELKKFDKDKDFKETLSDRILMAHRRYYMVEAGYDTLMRPIEKVEDHSKYLKLWKKQIKINASQTNRIVWKIIKMNDMVMQKINNYLEK
jgi:hypothetical protein